MKERYIANMIARNNRIDNKSRHIKNEVIAMLFLININTNLFILLQYFPKIFIINY